MGACVECSKMCPNSDIDIKKSTNENITINTKNKIKKRNKEKDINNNIKDLDLGNIYISQDDNNEKPIMDINKVNEILTKENQERKSYKNEIAKTN